MHARIYVYTMYICMYVHLYASMWAVAELRARKTKLTSVELLLLLPPNASTNWSFRHHDIFTIMVFKFRIALHQVASTVSSRHSNNANDILPHMECHICSCAYIRRW